MPAVRTRSIGCQSLADAVRKHEEELLMQRNLAGLDTLYSLRIPVSRAARRTLADIALSHRGNPESAVSFLRKLFRDISEDKQVGSNPEYARRAEASIQKRMSVLESSDGGRISKLLSDLRNAGAGPGTQNRVFDLFVQNCAAAPRKIKARR